MESDEFGRLAYLIILGVAVGGYFLAENRASLGKSARQAAVWGLIFIGVIGAVGLWSDIRNDVMPQQSVIGEGKISVPRGFDGHYYLVLTLNDIPIEFVVDTGASDVVLSKDDAEKIGIDLDTLNFSGLANTANGTVATARARIETMRLGDDTARRFSVSVNGGEMDGSLLGMSYLRRFERIEITGDELILTR